jgi:hypothetical protein
MEQPMQRLSAEKILAVWEAGRSQHALDRSLTIILAASPGASRAALADLSIGERDARLLQLRALVLGPRAEGFAECPGCAERVEFPLDTATFAEGRASARPPGVPALYEAEANGNRISFRLPTSRDLAEAVAASDSSLALRALVERCAGQADLPNETVEAVSRVMLAADPTAEITLRLVCPSCDHRWELLFDIGEFFWTEIAVQAQRLLREIDALARAYGWTEREILSLPGQRRQAYLELVAA